MNTTPEQRAEWLEQLGGLNEDNIAGLVVGGFIRSLIEDIEELEKDRDEWKDSAEHWELACREEFLGHE